MQDPKQARSFGRALFFVVFNVGAVRNASELCLFSRAFGLGLVFWAISSGVVLFRLGALIALPGWFTASLTVFSVFTGCCWVAFPLLVYLAKKADQLLARQIAPGRLIKTLTGAALWHQAVQGKLTLQFLSALLLESGFVWMLFPWHISTFWQVLFHIAFFLNTIFYLIFPLLLFLGAWAQRGIHKALFHRHHFV